LQIISKKSQEFQKWCNKASHKSKVIASNSSNAHKKNNPQQFKNLSYLTCHYFSVLCSNWPFHSKTNLAKYEPGRKYEKISFTKEIIFCSWPSCSCPLYEIYFSWMNRTTKLTMIEYWNNEIEIHKRQRVLKKLFWKDNIHAWRNSPSKSLSTTMYNKEKKKKIIAGKEERKWKISLIFSVFVALMLLGRVRNKRISIKGLSTRKNLLFAVQKTISFGLY